MKKFALTILALFGILATVILIRAAGFDSRQIQSEPLQAIGIDRVELVKRLSEAIRFKTLSLQETVHSNPNEFLQLHAFIDKSFPRLRQSLNKETVGRYSLLYTWPGKDKRLKPCLLMAHMDVVPVEAATESSWQQPPFSGQVADGFIWGRGAMDDKASVLGILEAVEYLLTSGFEPSRTVYLAFGHDEEIGGNDAAKIAGFLQSRGVELEYVLDEGLNIFNDIIDGVSAPVALIGIAEKGYLSLQLTAASPGGHSSAPPTHTAISVMSLALQRLEGRPFPARLSEPTREMIEFLGPEMSWPKRLAVANLWLFDPLLKKQLSRSPLINALIRTTVTPTIFHAGVKENVLPTKASAVINLRLAPGETVGGAIAHVRATIDDPNISVRPLPVQLEPSSVSDIQSTSFASLHRTIRQTAPQALVAPALLVAATDSRHYQALTKNIFRFLPITLGPEDTRDITVSTSA
jgi:carboxypeptidase PM20D1